MWRAASRKMAFSILQKPHISASNAPLAGSSPAILPNLPSLSHAALGQNHNKTLIRPIILFCYCTGICINSDTSSDPPISRKGQGCAIDNAAFIESALIIEKPDIALLPPSLIAPAGLTDWIINFCRLPHMWVFVIVKLGAAINPLESA
jgi:hypothetical protein